MNNFVSLMKKMLILQENVKTLSKEVLSNSYGSYCQYFKHIAIFGKIIYLTSELSVYVPIDPRQKDIDFTQQKHIWVQITFEELPEDQFIVVKNLFNSGINILVNLKILESIISEEQDDSYIILSWDKNIILSLMFIAENILKEVKTFPSELNLMKGL